MTQGLDAGSLKSIAQAHPILRTLFTAVASRTNICILDAQRGAAAQAEAKRTGKSNAGPGESAHNYSPACALDVVPDFDARPDKRIIKWGDVPAFLDLRQIVGEEAKRLGYDFGPIELQECDLVWGGDWDGDGNRFDQKLIDLPHYELRRWRDMVKRGSLKLLG